MPQIQLDCFSTLIRYLPEIAEIAKQLKIANELKAWELKLKYKELTPPYDHAAQIDAIMK